VIYDTLSRSQAKPHAIVLATGLEITEDRRPRGAFADKVWGLLKEAKAAHGAAQASYPEDLALKALLLSGGGDERELPEELAMALSAFATLPTHRQEKCRCIQTPILSAAIEASRQPEFKRRMEEVLSALG